jgi:hypothetical protein
LGRGELAEGTGPGSVVVPQVLGQHPSQVVLIDDQRPVEAVIPRDPCAAEGFPYRAVRPIANRHLVVIGAALIPEPLNVHDDYGPVNGQPLILYRPHPARTKAEAKL